MNARQDPTVLGELVADIAATVGEQVFTKLPPRYSLKVFGPQCIPPPPTPIVVGSRSYPVNGQGQRKPESVRAVRRAPSGNRGTDGKVVRGPATANKPTRPTFGLTKLARSKVERKGGWPWTIELSFDEVRYISEIDKAATDAGTPLNKMVTIRGCSTDQPLANEKRRLAKKIADIGQALHRAGFEHIGNTVYERKRGKDIHAHHQLNVPRAALPVLARFQKSPDVVVTDTNEKRVGYVTKQREQLSPDFERTMPSLFHREPGDYIPGPRFSPTRELKALLPAVSRPPSNVTPRPRIDSIRTTAGDNNGRFRHR